MKRWWIVLLLAAIVCAVIGLAVYSGYRAAQPPEATAPEAPITVPVTRGRVDRSIVAPGRVVRTGELTLTSGVGAKIAAVHVRPGDVVEAGDLLVELDTSQLQKAVTAASQSLERAMSEHAYRQSSAELALRIAQARLSQARAQAPLVVAAREAVADAQTRLDGLPGDSEAAAVESARAQLEAAQAQLDRTLAEKAVHDQLVIIAQAEAERASLDLEQLALGIDPRFVRALDQAEAELALALLSAPTGGVVIGVAARVGDVVSGGSTLVTMVDPKALEIEATVIEEDLPLVEIGQIVGVYFDATPDLEAIAGKVTRIVPERVEGARPLYPVYIVVAEMPAEIASGMTAESVIVIDRRSDVLRLPRVLVRAPSGGSASVAARCPLVAQPHGEGDQWGRTSGSPSSATATWDAGSARR